MKRLVELPSDVIEARGDQHGQRPGVGDARPVHAFRDRRVFDVATPHAQPLPESRRDEYPKRRYREAVEAGGLALVAVALRTRRGPP